MHKCKRPTIFKVVKHMVLIVNSCHTGPKRLHNWVNLSISDSFDLEYSNEVFIWKYNEKGRASLTGTVRLFWYFLNWKDHGEGQLFIGWKHHWCLFLFPYLLVSYVSFVYTFLFLAIFSLFFPLFISVVSHVFPPIYHSFIFSLFVSSLLASRIVSFC